MQVVNQLQSGSISKRDGWRSELPRAGLGVGVLDNMKDEKRKDVSWQGKCSGTVYVCSYWTIKYIFVLFYTGRYSTLFVIFISLLVNDITSCRYIAGSEAEGHFSLINEACSM